MKIKCNIWMWIFRLKWFQNLCSNDSLGKWWTVTGFTVMRTTGDVVLFGEEAKSADRKAASALIHIFPALGSKSSSKKLLVPCKHRVTVLALEMDGEDFLLASCVRCRDIKLLQTKSGRIHVVDKYKFRSNQKSVLCMTRGEPGTLYLSIVGGSLLEFRYSTSGLKGPRKIKIETDVCTSLCYIPVPRKALVCCCRDSVRFKLQVNETIFAISPAGNDVFWEQKEKLDGANVKCATLLYIEQHRVILANDVGNNRFLVLNPSDGSHLQTLKCMVHTPMSHDISLVTEFDFHKDQINVLYSKIKKEKVHVPPIRKELCIAVFKMEYFP